MTIAHTNFEKSLWSQNKKYIVGIDEVGRGAWAGPMVIGAVIFPSDLEPPFILADSKLLSAKKRERTSILIQNYSLESVVFEVPVEYINNYGLSQAGQFGYIEVLNKLSTIYDHVLIDAFKIKKIPDQIQTAIIKGDQQSVSIAAASIIAKVYRDKLMKRLHLELPDFSFDKNVGYGTKAHRQALAKYGLSKFHRTSFNLTKWLNPQIEN